ncbi:MAG: GGDEF domain-containing protein, partial [Deltaproteobacteria bacterium]|nr:GGDEF domain-containing protein [Deltaproteobacteria bacterium]
MSSQMAENSHDEKGAKTTLLKSAPRATIAATHSSHTTQDRQVHLVLMVGSPMGHVFTLKHGMNIIGRDDAAQVKIDDAGISRHHAMIFYDASNDSFLIRDMDSRNGTSVNGVALHEPLNLKRGDKIEVGLNTVLRLSYGDEVETRFAKQMLQETLRDGLTGIYNRRKLEESLETLVPAAREAVSSPSGRGASSLSLVLFDIDHFKHINDTFGHPAGDAVLRWLCEQVSAMLRPEDLFARYGGEEFVVLCPQTGEEVAAELAQRVCDTVARQPCVTEGTVGADLLTTQEIDPAQLSPGVTKIPVTISLGVAELALADA